jgi:flagellar motor component MotA
MLEYHRALQQEEDEQAPTAPPSLACSKDEELIEALVQLRRLVAQRGVLVLEDADLEAAPLLLRKGLELYLEGYDPAMVQSVLEQTRESLVTRFCNTQNLIIDGVGALMSSTPAHEMREKLGAFLLSD